MKFVKKSVSVILIVSLLLCFTVQPFAAAADVSLKVDGSAPKTDISDNLFGVFFEDISYAADGGLSANQISNNSFEFSYVENQSEQLKWTYWMCESGSAAMEYGNALNANNPTCLRIDANSVVSNCGYPDKDDGFGIYLAKGAVYDFSFYADSSAFSGTVKADFVDSSGKSCISAAPTFDVSGGYEKYSVAVTCAKTAQTKLVLTVSGEGELDVDFFNLISHSSHGYGDSRWKYSTLRSDLYDALDELNPAFVRFPGGCVAEGTLDWDYTYNWKKTIGEPEQRTQIPNLWGYNQSMAIGFYEYFCLCEDLEAQAVPVVHAGLMCQGRGNTNYMPLDSAEFEQHVQDVLDLIEYANGSADSGWGAVRAQNGHPEPFNIKYVAIGNENWAEEYFERFDVIYNAVKAAYPEITIISSAGAWAWGNEFEYAWDLINDKYTDTVVDEHYYIEPGWFVGNNDRYDSYDRNGAKVFVGEYAAHRGGGNGITKSNFQTAIAEASYMTGLERNGDIVELASYAPLFSRLDHTQWAPNMIWFTTDEVVKTTTYYIQQLFMNNTGSRLVSITADKEQEGVFYVASEDEESEVLYIKVVNTTGESKKVSLGISGYDNLDSQSEMQYFGNGLYNQGNTFENGEFFTPRTRQVAIKNGSISQNVGPYSLNVFRVGYGGNTSEDGPSVSGYSRGTDFEVRFYEFILNFVLDLKKTYIFKLLFGKESV